MNCSKSCSQCKYLEFFWVYKIYYCSKITGITYSEINKEEENRYKFCDNPSSSTIEKTIKNGGVVRLVGHIEADKSLIDQPILLKPVIKEIVIRHVFWIFNRIGFCCSFFEEGENFDTRLRTGKYDNNI